MPNSRELPPPKQMAAQLAQATPIGAADGNRLAGLLAADPARDEPCRRDYGERYEPLDVLGRGGQGVVLRARDTVLNREVAIKAVRPPYEPLREQAIEREARFGGALEHPNILPTYDLGHDETGSPFFVMKKVGGANLEDLLKKARAAVGRDRAAVRHTPRGAVLPDADGAAAGEDYSTRRLLNIFQQVCHAVEYAHSRGVYHLDLKPQNVALGPFGEVYVLDWGFAERKEAPTRVIAGTPMYFAPERMEGAPPDPRCDVYSLGVILYRILTLRPPRDLGDLTWGEFRKQWRDFPVIPPRLRDPRIPRDLEAIVLKALADDPARRYAAAGDLDRDLDRFLDLLPVTAYREGVWSRMGKFAKRHRALLASAGIVLAAALASGGLVWRSHIRVREERSRAEEARSLESQAQNEKNQQLVQAKRDLDRRREIRRLLEQAGELLERNRDAARAVSSPDLREKLMRPAIQGYTDAIELDRDAVEPSAEPYYGRARALRLAGRPLDAVDNYRRAHRIDPAYLFARYHAGRLLLSLGRVADAAGEFAELDAAEADEYADLAAAWQRLGQGRYAEALECAERAAARNPAMAETMADIWEIRARASLAVGAPTYSPAAALEAYDRLVDYGHADADIHARRGLLRHARYLDRGDPADFDAALADWDQALARDARSFPALLGRGRAWSGRARDLERAARAAALDANRARDEADRARWDASHAFDRKAPAAVVENRRADAGREEKNAEDADYRARKFREDARRAALAARTSLDAALALRPRAAGALAARAALHEADGDAAGALADYAAALRATPPAGLAAPLEERGLFHLRQGEPGSAESDFSRALACLDDAASLDGPVGDSPAGDGDDPLAAGQPWSEEGREAARARLLYQRGWARLALEQPAEAEADFDEALARTPADDATPAALARWLALRARGRLQDEEPLRRRGDADANEVRKALTMYYLGEIDRADEASVLRLAGNADERCQALFFLGAFALADGDPERAAAHFAAAEAAGLAGTAEHALAIAFRARAAAALAAARARDVRPFIPTLPTGAPAPVILDH